MDKPTDRSELDGVEHALRVIFQSPRPRPDFVTALERQLAARTARELNQRSRRMSLFAGLSRPARVAALGLLALLLALALIWGINNLIPDETPGSKEDRFRLNDRLPTPDPATLQAIQSVLDREAQAHREHDSVAYQALLDSQAEPEWVQTGIERIQTVVSPLPQVVLIERAVVVEDLAMVLALIESEEPMYTMRYLRNTEEEGWKLTSAIPETWGEVRTIGLEHLTLNYYAFDEPYVLAVVPKIETFVDSVGQDFGASLKGEPRLDLTLVPSEGPKSFWDEVSGERMPFMHSFLIDQAGSLEEYLAWGLYDKMARVLIARAMGETVMEERWSNIAEALVLWEVFQARGEPSREEILRFVQSPDAPLDLAFLLDTGPYDAPNASERVQAQVALITFLAETYGRQVLPDFLRAIFTQRTWQDVLRASIGADPADFEQRWQNWVTIQELPPRQVPESALLYTVQAGDTLESITDQTGIPLEIILALNDLNAGSPLIAGQRLVVDIGRSASTLPPASPPTPVTPAPTAEPLAYGVSSDEIRRRLIESPGLWNTLWVDAQVTTTSKNEMHIDREQAWISQPGKIRWLTGQLGGEPHMARVTNGYQAVWIDLDSQEPVEVGDGGGFVIPSWLQRVIFPTNYFANRGGAFRVFNTEAVAGREAVAVDWTDDEGHLVDRFWIDAYTGVILRWKRIPKEYPDASGRVIPNEILITAIAYDIDFLAETFDLSRPVPQEFSTGYQDR